MIDMKSIMLDTNAYSAYRRGNSDVLEALGRAERVLMSVFVLGELLYGFRGGNRHARNRRELSSFLDKRSVFVAVATEETSEQFAVTKEALRQAGTPLPMNDVWIAAHCIQLGATIVTFDGHFNTVPGLRVWPES